MQKKVRVIVDAMSGDNAPEAIIKGAVSGGREYGADIIFTGDENKINEILKTIPTDGVGISVIPSESVVTMEDDPIIVQKEKKNSSMAVACISLHEDKGDVVISSGNTGALYTAATLFVRRHKGIRRASLGAIINFGSPFMIVDAGANTEVTPENLLQFAVMGDLYFKSVMGVENPRIGLLNNGSEECKGTPVYREAYQLLKKSGLNFVGNCEGRDLTSGFCDVAVCDGFTGNLVLKTIEGMGQFFIKSLKGIFTQNIITKLTALILKKDIKTFRASIDHKKYGGAPFLGIAKPVIKAHGSAGEETIKYTVKQAVDYVTSGLNEKIASGIAETIKYEETANE